MADQSFRAMMERVYAQYGRDPDDSEGEDGVSDVEDVNATDPWGRPAAQPRGKRRAANFATPTTTATAAASNPNGHDPNADWGQFFCQVLKQNTNNEAPNLIKAVERDLVEHEREWHTVDTVRVPLTAEQRAMMGRPVAAPVGFGKNRAAGAAPGPTPGQTSASTSGIKSIYDDILEQYKDVVPATQREMFRAAATPDGPPGAASGAGPRAGVLGAEPLPPYSAETETPPLDHAASALTAILNRIEHSGALLRALLRNDQRCLLTEQASRTNGRASLLEFEKSVRPRLGSHAQMRRWRQELVGPWCGSQMRMSASVTHQLLERSMERWFGGVQRVHLDVYHPDDGLFVFCIYACASARIAGVVDGPSTSTPAPLEPISQLDLAAYARYKALDGSDTRQYVFEGYLVCQSTESHEADLAAKQVYGASADAPQILD